MTAIGICFSDLGFSPKHHDAHRRVEYGPGHRRDGFIALSQVIFQNDSSPDTTAALTNGGDYGGANHSHERRR